MFKFAIPLFLTALCWGAVSNVTVSPTRQQAAITFTIPNPAACTLRVYTNKGMTSKIDDTNTALFSGSESCTRAYNTIIGKQVTAVIGRRTSIKALDGFLHSLSLQVATTYYFIITDTNDATTYTGSFTTKNIPWGDTHPEEVPYSADGYNHWAYPDIDWSDAGYDKSYIDPVSGVLFKRGPRELSGLAGPEGKYINEEFTFATALDVHGGKWTNPTDAINKTTAGPFASYSGTTRDPLWLPIQDFTSYTGGLQLDDIRLNLYGYVTDTGNVEDRKVLACIGTNYSFNTDTCVSPELELTLPTTVGNTSAPTSWPSYGFAGWNIGRFLRNQEASIVKNGIGATVTNSVVTLPVTDNNTSAYLPPQAVVGEPVAIGFSWYNIGSIKDAVNFTLSQPGVNAVNSGWELGGFGIRLRKKTTNNNTIFIGASYSGAFSGPPGAMGANGNVESCSRLTFPVNYDTSGNALNPPSTGRMCFSYGSATLDTEAGWMFILTDTGETRYLSPMFQRFGSDSPETAWGAFHEADPYSMYAYHSGHFFKVTYDYARCHFQRWAGNAYDHFNYPDDCLTWTDLNSGQDIPTQITNYVASHPSTMWDSSFSGQFRLYKLLQAADGHVYASMYKSMGQDAACFQAIVDVTSGATLLKLFDSFYGTLPGVRWAGCHSNGFDMIYGSNFQPLVLSNLGTKDNPGYMSGPYLLPAVTAVSTDGVTFNSSDTTLNPGRFISCGGGGCTKAGADTRCTIGGTVEPWLDGGGNCIDLSSDGGYSSNAVAGQCATNPFGITGPQCAWFKLPTDAPCTPYNDSLEVSHSSACPWGSGYTPMTYQAGDYMSRATANGSTTIDLGVVGKFEKFRILTKTSDGAGGWILMVQRWSTCDNPISSHTSYGGGSNFAVTFFEHIYSFGADALLYNGWRPFMTGTGNCAGGGLWVDITNPSLATTQTVVENSDIGQEHNAIGANAPGSFMQVGHDASRADIMPAFLTDPPDKSPGGQDVSFFNKLYNVSSQVIEQYPSLTNWSAPSKDRFRLYWDFRHINPSNGSTGEVPVKIWGQTFTLVSGVYTFRVTPYNDTFGDFKSRPNMVFSSAGPFKNISSPTTGNIISDATPYSYCIAYKTNECLTGSSVGDVYVSSPIADIPSGACITDTTRTYTPCVTPLWHHAGWMIEGDARIDDPLGYKRRRITMSWTGPGAQYQYTTPHVVPSTQFAFIQAFWPNGVRGDHMVLKMPPSTEIDTIDRSTFVNIPFVFPTGSDYIRIRFGYGENSDPSTALFCQTRQEECVTDSSTLPFAFAQTDTLTPADCRTGCTVNIPSISGRMVYYRIERSKNGTSNWISTPTKVAATP